LSAKQVAQYYSASKQEAEPTIEKPAANKPDADLVEDFLKIVIEREKAEQGCNFEVYDRLLKKCRKIFKGFPTLTFQSIDYDKCVKTAHILAKHRGYIYTAKSFQEFAGKSLKGFECEFYHQLDRRL
jgi:hypothetical protein